MTLYRICTLGILFIFYFHNGYSQNFSDVSLVSGITEFFGFGYAGGGISCADFNNDGYPDLSFGTEQGREAVFYQNNGGVDFTRVFFGVTDTSHQKQIIWVDLDNDDDLDLFIAAYNMPNKIYTNDGNLNFTDISASSGIPQVDDDTFGTSFGDIDLDGDLDMYISNHYLFQSELFANNGDNTFTNITAGSGINPNPSLLFCTAFFDYDRDGDLDLYKINDKSFLNEFYLNNGDLTFTDISQASCSDLQLDAMGITTADFNNNGKLDFYITNSDRPTSSQLNEIVGNVLLKNDYPNKMINITNSSQTNYQAWCWGTSAADFDNDGWQDIYTSSSKNTSPENKLYFNNGDETFTCQAPNEMIGDDQWSFSCSIIDFNMDGQMDIVSGTDTNENFKLWRNNISNDHNRIQIALEGIVSNKNGVGSWIEVYAGGDVFTRFTQCGTGYLSQESYKNHVGIGQHASADSVIITWPSGIIDRLYSLPTNSCIEVIEGTNSFTEIIFIVPITERITNDSFSVARNWMELLLESIRQDFARPTVHARNLFHSSVAMYDAWSAYQRISTPYMLGNTQSGYNIPFVGIAAPADTLAAQEEAISHAMYNLLFYRFQNSPGAATMIQHYQLYMDDLGLDYSDQSINYTNGSPASLGNYIAHHMIQFGFQDGSNEQNGYSNQYYQSVNDSLVMNFPGNPNISDFNRWQPLTLDVFIDQSGNEMPLNTPDFLSPEWGNVSPFALHELDKTTFTRNGNEYNVYCDPGSPPLIQNNEQYKWGFALVSAWSSHLDASSSVAWDISPASIGNIDTLPNDPVDYPNFYDFENGGDASTGHAINPITQTPYVTQKVKRADYARVLAEFWADGPDSETPPGHWFTLLNYVSEHPSFSNQFEGEGSVLHDLEWDVKAYFSLGGPLHDAAISAWSIKGWYDYIRPVSAIRAMAGLGQSSDINLPSYHPQGLPLIPGFIELIGINDPLSGTSNEHFNKIKVYSWKGPDFISNPDTDDAGVDWIRAENWWPYQRPSFVTPPFAGYVSGHSTFSRAAAEVMTTLTGSAYFPDGLGQFSAEKNEFLVFENGPSEDVILQWATYRDASDQCSLSRIWGGIHPPADDIPGRIIGEKIGIQGYNLARQYILGTICSDSISISNNPIPHSFYKAQEIYSSGTVSSPNVKLDASQSINLNPGFQVLPSAQFHAVISGCL